MRAIVSSNAGPLIQDVPQPTPGPGFILVKVKACALNRADFMMLRGGGHAAGSGVGGTLGLEWAGEVVQVGAGVETYQVGDRVMAAGLGAFAEYVVAHAKMVYPIPNGLSFEEAAALPVALQTSHDAVSTNGQLVAGQSVLIQGASSAVGLMTMQVAKHMGAVQVIGTSTSAERRVRLPDYGADLALDSKDADWVTQVLKATDTKGVDLLVDFLAGPYINGNQQATRIGGRMVNVGRMAGESGDFNFDLHSMRRLTYVGVTFRTRTPVELVEVIARTAHDLTPALKAGSLRMPIDKVYKFEAFSDALGRMARNEHFGKIVLSFG